MENTIKLLKEHRSIRAFNDSPITENEISEIINCAMRGATAGNMMLYSIIKIQDKNTLEFLSKKCDNQKFITSSKFALLFLADSYKFFKYFKLRNVNDYKDPSVADLMLGIQDAMIAAQNSVIAAESMNIGTCYIGDILENYEDIKSHFNLPKNVMPLTLIVFGKYDTTPPLRDRFDEKSVVFDETYPEIDDTFINEMFENKELIKPDFASYLYDFKINSEFFEEMKRSIRLHINEWDQA